MVTPYDGTDLLCRKLYGETLARHYIGGSEAPMLYMATEQLIIKDQQIAELKAQVEEFTEILELFARINQVADKFYLPHLHEVGDEWDEFVRRMQEAIVKQEEKTGGEV